MAVKKCSLPDGIVIKPDGANELDACRYIEKEIHTNVTVVISQCKRCGHVMIEWHRTEETEDIILEPFEDEISD